MWRMSSVTIDEEEIWNRLLDTFLVKQEGWFLPRAGKKHRVHQGLWKFLKCCWLEFDRRYDEQTDFSLGKT